MSSGEQTITFGALANKTFGDADFGVSATSSSGLSVTFVAASGPCTVASNTVHLTGAGSCTIRASQSGDSNYNAAPDVDRAFMIAKANQAIVVTTPVPASAIYATTFGTAATGGGSGNAVAITTAGACSVSAGGTGSATIQMTSGTGTCTVQYNQAGNANYNAATQVQTVTPIGYAFEGFFSPIDMSTSTTVWNQANAGQAVPAKWRLTLEGLPVASGASFVGLFS